jgi:hypothetical protein
MGGVVLYDELCSVDAWSKGSGIKGDIYIDTPLRRNST